MLNPTERLYVSRQLPLPGIGEEGQARLRGARVLVVGAGGLGCAALTQLACCGVGFLRVCEPDIVELHNLHRQPLYAHDEVAQPKGLLACDRLRRLNPHLKTEWIPQPFTPERAASLLEGMDLALDCGDSVRLSHQMNEACLSAGKPLVSAAVHRWQGQVLTMRPDGAGGCLACLWPVPPPEPAISAATGIVGTVPGVVGVLQAQAALLVLLGLPGGLDGHLLLVDLLEFTTRRVERSRRATCPVCGKEPGPIATA